MSKELENALNGLLEALNEQHLTTLNATLADTLKTKIERSFEEQKSPSGDGWAKRKVSASQPFRSDKILYKSGMLSNQWASESSATHFKAFSPAKSPKGFAYGLVHQFGTKDETVPARPFLPIDKNHEVDAATKELLLEEVRAYFENAVRSIK